MRVIIAHDLCEGNARCIQAAPDIFEVRDDDKSYVRIERPGENLRAAAERAVQVCPRRAIRIVEED